MKIPYETIMESCIQYIKDERPKLNEPKKAANFIRPFFSIKPTIEQMMAILLNVRLKPIDAPVLIAEGCSDRCFFTTKQLFREAIAKNASVIILAHNHPSGDIEPSPEDISMTRNMVRAGHIIGISVKDHIIISTSDYYSFRENNIMPSKEETSL